MDDIFDSLIDFSENFYTKMNEEWQKLKKLNVMILGKTGVGKSMLINKVFKENFVEAGIGKPITQHIKRIEKPGYPLAIYDTPGLELTGGNTYDSLYTQVSDVIDSGIKSGDMKKCNTFYLVLCGLNISSL